VVQQRFPFRHNPVSYACSYSLADQSVERGSQMAECVYCGSETLMFINSVPVCIDCADDLRHGQKQLHRESSQDTQSSS